MKYPRYKFHQDLRRKLSPSDIKTIRKLYPRFKILNLAKKYNVSTTTIHYWVLSASKRRQLNKFRYQSVTRKDNTRHQSNFFHRKYSLMPEFRRYVKLCARKYYNRKK